ncbi:MscL family protein [Candidatus Saccharibacteria bacterium]|nr:MscL family protein [Candidatus Saccharibacteria bacterium]
MNKQLKGFLKFVREQGVVGLAVGLAIGTQAGKTVEAIVKGFINPIVSFIVGDTKGLESATWTVFESDSRELIFGWGTILSSLITLIAVAGVIYYIVHGLKLDKLDRKKD